MSGMSTPERRGILPQPYRRPDSPYPFPQTPFRQTFALTSPRRVEPFIVNVGVDPKPLMDTESGERFICDISLDVQPGGSGMLPQMSQRVGGAIPFHLDTSADSDRTFVGEMSDSSRGSERTLVNANSPIIRGRHIERYNVSPEVTPTSIHRKGLFTSSAEMNEMTSPERRGRLPQPYRRPDSPYPLPQIPFRKTNALVSPFQFDWSAESDRTLVNEMNDFSRSSERTLVNESTPTGILKRNIRDGTSPEPSPVIKGPFYRPQSQMSDYYGSSAEYPPVIHGPCHRPQSQMSDYYGSSPDALDTSSGTSREGTLEMSYSPVIKRRRRLRYDVLPTSTDLYTPRGIYRGVRRRRIPGRHPIHELPWSPTYLPEDARSPVSGVTSPPHWFNRSVSWEKSDDICGSCTEPSPLIKGPCYRPQSQMSDYYGSSPDALDTSADTSSEGTFEIGYSPLIKRRRRRLRYNVLPTSTDLYTPRGIYRGVRRRRIPGRHSIHELPWSPTYLPEDARSPVSGVTSLVSGIKSRPHRFDRSISWEKSDETYGPSPEPSPVIKRPFYTSQSPYSDRSSPSLVIKSLFGYQPSNEESHYDYESSPSPVSESYDRHRSPYSDHSSPSPLINCKPPFGFQPSSDESYYAYESSPSPVSESYDRHRSPYSDHSSPSPLINCRPPFGFQPSSDESYYAYESSPSPISERSGGYPSPDWDSILPIFYPDSAHNRQ